jgi:CRISPR-associated protein Csx17
MTHELHLRGCTPTPLSHYLKALGVFRVVAEQADASAAGRWEDEHFVLSSQGDRDRLQRFFLEQYQPTPFLAPWNGGSGFYFQEEKLKAKDPATGKRVKTGRRTQPTEATKTLETILNSTCGRLAQYREAAAIAKAAVEAMGLHAAPIADAKNKLIVAVRNRAPEISLQAIDAALVLTADDVKYPPLLGTGGNDGNLDFTNNFMQRILELFDPEDGTPLPGTEAWLRCSLWAEPVPGLVSRAIGQFSPGASGGPNAGTGFGGVALVNPWDFVLMLEGALLFAAAITRRMEGSDPASLSYPFTTRPAAAGAGSVHASDQGPARPEMWMPCWRRPAGIDEVRSLLTEGRVTLGRRPARDGLDFARGLAALGVDRGLDGFERYGFLMRSGKSYLAVPLGRLATCRNREADLMADLDSGGFLERLRGFARRDDAPGRVRFLVHRLEDRLFDLARKPAIWLLQEILCLLGELERACSVSPKAREAVPPVHTLSETWVTRADDGSDEFRLAAALAGIRAPGLPMRPFVAPVALETGGWAPAGNHTTVWGEGPLLTNLIEVIGRRLLEAERLGLDDKPFGGAPPADLEALSAFLTGATDDVRLSRLFRGLTLCRMPEFLPERQGQGAPIPGALALMKLLFSPDSLLRWLGVVPSDGRLPIPPEIPALLRTGHTARALETAWRRARSSGLTVPPFPRGAPAPAGLEGRRLLAAAVVPLRPGDVGRLSRNLLEPRAEMQAAPHS